MEKVQIMKAVQGIAEKGNFEFYENKFRKVPKSNNKYYVYFIFKERNNQPPELKKLFNEKSLSFEVVGGNMMYSVLLSVHSNFKERN